jgi:hypothetical protein
MDLFADVIINSSPDQGWTGWEESRCVSESDGQMIGSVDMYRLGSSNVRKEESGMRRTK